MDRISQLKIWLTILFIGWFFAGECSGSSLSTKFADVMLSGLKPGMVYSLKKEQNLGFKVINNSNGPVDVEVVIEIPVQRYLKENYESIPDPGWIKIVPQRFVLQPGESSDCDIIISVPVGEEWLKRHFQASIITQTVTNPNTPGISISVALQSRLRFSTGPSPIAVMNEYRRKVMEALNLDIAPLSLYLSNVPVGEPIELGTVDFETLQLVNKSRNTYTVKFRKPSEMTSYGMATGYEPAPDLKWLIFNKSQLKVGPKKIQDIGMKINIPDKEEYKDKKYEFIVVGDVQGFDLPIQVYGRIYVSTAK